MVEAANEILTNELDTTTLLPKSLMVSLFHTSEA